MGLELRAIQSPIFSEPLDFTFHAQAFTLLVGSSGSGKSSLFQIIAQVSSLPYSGQVLINGSEVGQLSIIERVQTVGILFQNPNHQFTMENLFEELIFTLEILGIPVQELILKYAELSSNVVARTSCTVQFITYQVEKSKRLLWLFSLL